MKIDEMPAGRDMDALVAERVMGWTEVGCESNEHHTEYVPIGLPPRVDPNRAAPYTVRVRLPHFSSAIACAWEVVERMGTLRCSVVRGTLMGSGWAADFWVEHDGHRVGQARADTAPLAICRAALKAVGVNDA